MKKKIYLTLCSAIIIAIAFYSCKKNSATVAANGKGNTTGSKKLDDVTIHGALIYKDSTVTAFFNRTSGDIANDDGHTILLSNGSVLWMLGDSYIDHYDAKTKTVPCLFQVRNGALLQSANNWDWHQTSTLLDPVTHSTLFKSTDDFTWPGGGIQLGDTVYVYCDNFKNTGSGSLAFTSTGPMWSKIKFPEMTVAGYKKLPNFNGIGFGISFDKGDDGYVYAYGNKQTFIYNNIYIARFPANNPNGAWTFWDGTTYNTDVTKAAVIGQSYSSGVHVAKVKDRYIMVSSEFSVGCDQGTRIFAARSSFRTGPFTPLKQQKVIWVIDDDKLNGHYPFFYAPIIHPELVNSKGEVLLTYAINGYGTCVTTCINNRKDPNVYRLQGIRVPLRLVNETYP